MPPGKRIPRVPRFSPPATAPQQPQFFENPKPNDFVSPKHIPLPNMPQDGDLLFESMTFVFSLLVTLLQFLNVYRTLWWLPNSNVNYTMHFFLIDPHLVCFIVVIMSRHLLYAIGCEIVRHATTSRISPQSMAGLRMFVLGLVIGTLIWCFYFISRKHSELQLFYLVYPVAMYILMFGFQSSPFLELNDSEKPVFHNCSTNAQAIRTEVESMREDFNMRMKRVMFSSVIGAYYTSFIPCAFAQNYVRYDWRWTAQQTGLTWATLASRFSAHALSPSYVDALHRASVHLNPYYNGTAVSGKWKNAHARFYVVFKNPSTLLCFLLTMLLSSICLELFILFNTTYWHYLMSLAILLLSNYYTLFKLVRDYLITWKVYKAENTIQEKNQSTPIT